MCNFSEKLIAWLDHELAENEATDVERHVRGCAECWSLLNKYETAGNMFEAYCEAVMASKRRRKMPAWTPVAVGAAATAAAVVAILFVFFPAPVQELPLDSPAAAALPAIVQSPELTPVKRSHRRQHAVTPVQSSRQDKEASWLAAGPAIQVTIPADAMFPPGAVPEGVNFVADISIAADGSPERLQLRP